MKQVANPIICRSYGVAGEPGREVVLIIGKPRPSLGDWACSVVIVGVPEGRRRRIYGVDPLQALQLAILHARHTLDASGLPLTWLDGAVGDVGIPLSVPTGHGFEFQRRLERYMERENRRFDEAIAAFVKEKERLHATKTELGACLSEEPKMPDADTAGRSKRT